jgi:hypothetical protein
MSALLALLSALVMGLSVHPGTAAHQAVAPRANPAAASPVSAHRAAVRPMDVFGGPGM